MRWSKEVLWSETSRDKSSALSCRFHTLHHMPMGCWRVPPRFSAPRWCRFDYTHLWGSEFIFQKNRLSRCAKSHMSNSWHPHLWRQVACIPGASQIVWLFAAPQECYMKNLIYSLPFYSEENLTVCITEAAASGKLAYLGTYDSFCCVVVGFVLVWFGLVWFVCSSIHSHM
jgi:hypothetical protein